MPNQSTNLDSNRKISWGYLAAMFKDAVAFPYNSIVGPHRDKNFAGDGMEYALSAMLGIGFATTTCLGASVGGLPGAAIGLYAISTAVYTMSALAFPELAEFLQPSLTAYKERTQQTSTPCIN